MDIVERSPLPSHARTLPAIYYVDPSHYAREFAVFFEKRWVYAGHASDLMERGAFEEVRIGEESLILTRGDDGRIRAFFNVCRHRGTQLCHESSGRFASTIQCPYHAWTWDLSGRLLGAPHFEEGDGFHKADWPLKEARLETWDGHLFVHLGPGGLPLLNQLVGLPEKFAAWRMADLRHAHRVQYDVAANWKLIIQNYSECLHCPVIHPALNRLSHYLSGDNEPAETSHLGGAMTLREGIATMSFDGQARREYLPGLSEDQRRRVYYYAILPNLLLSLHPDYMLVHRLDPRACDRTLVDCRWYFHPDAMARADFDPSDAVEFWDLTNRQDWQVSEWTQLGMRSRAYEPGPYSCREELLHAFDRMVVQEIEGEEG